MQGPYGYQSCTEWAPCLNKVDLDLDLVAFPRNEDIASKNVWPTCMFDSFKRALIIILLINYRRYCLTNYFNHKALALMISTNVISSQILIFVTSHFTTLCRWKWWVFASSLCGSGFAAQAMRLYTSLGKCHHYSVPVWWIKPTGTTCHAQNWPICVCVGNMEARLVESSHYYKMS